MCAQPAADRDAERVDELLHLHFLRVSDVSDSFEKKAFASDIRPGRRRIKNKTLHVDRRACAYVEQTLPEDLLAPEVCPQGLRRPATATPTDDRQRVGPTVSRAAALAAPAPLRVGLVTTSAVPASEQNEVVSNVGSSLHELGNCKRCLFVFSPDGCSVGALCTFCHIWHGRTSRPSKATRERLKRVCTEIANVSDI